MSAPLIAVHGLKRSGKGTITSHLQRRYGFRVLKFAECLKALTELILREAGYDDDIIARCIESDLKEVALPGLADITPRRLMQVVGTEWRLLFAPGIYQDITANKQRRLRNAGIAVAVDDLRFPNELTALRAMATEEDAADLGLWMVERPVIPVEAIPGDIERIRSLVTRPLSFTPELCAKLTVEFARQCELDVTARRPEILRGASFGDAFEAFLKLESMLHDTSTMNKPHSSEKTMPAEEFSAVMVNDSDIASLEAKVDQAMEAFMARHHASAATARLAS